MCTKSQTIEKNICCNIIHSRCFLLPNIYLISCSSMSNVDVLKNSPSVTPSPSQSFLIVTMVMSFLLSSSMLYTVDGVTPAKVASSFGRRPFDLHISLIRKTTACLTVKNITLLDCIEIYAAEYTRLRNCS